MKEGGTIILTVVLLLCPGDAVFRCERETIEFGLPKEDTTTNQWFSCTQHCSRAAQCKYLNVCGTIYRRLFPEPGSRVAYNACLHEGCFYKVG